MANIVADGNKLIECGEDIVTLCDKYNSLIDELFVKISKMLVTSWSGESANSYVARAMEDKKRYIAFGNDLKLYGQVVKNTGKNINYIIEKWKDK